MYVSDILRHLRLSESPISIYELTRSVRLSGDYQTQS